MKTNYKLLGVLLFVGLLVMPLVIAGTTWQDISGESFGTFLRYIFGDIASVTNNELSNGIITVAVWLLVWITFSDIISTFSTFSKGVSWGAGGLIGIITANLGWNASVIAKLTGLFAFLGTIAVFVGLAAAFLAFIAVNWGTIHLGGWVKRRNAMMYADKAKAGGKKVAAGARVLKDVAEESGKGE